MDCATGLLAVILLSFVAALVILPFALSRRRDRQWNELATGLGMQLVLTQIPVIGLTTSRAISGSYRSRPGQNRNNARN